jgi:hypothetical protein
MLRYNFCIIISSRSQDPFFFFNKAQDSCVRVVSQIFIIQLSRSSCSIDNPYNISFEKLLHCLQNMWDLTPQTDLLEELPAEYSTESALADLTVSFLIRILYILIFGSF